MKKTFLLVLILTAFTLSFAETGLKIGGGAVLESTKITEKRVSPGVAISLELPLHHLMGAILNVA